MALIYGSTRGDTDYTWKDVDSSTVSLCKRSLIIITCSRLGNSRGKNGAIWGRYRDEDTRIAANTQSGAD